MLYGGRLNDCKQLFRKNSDCNNNNQKQSVVFEIVREIINISNIAHENTSTEFSSKPSTLRACIYARAHKNYYPGGSFNVTTITFDQYDNPVDGVVVKITQTITDEYLISHDNVITTNSSIRNFTFLVLVRNESLNGNQLKFALFLEGLCSNRVNLDISLKPCPFGFEFNVDIRKCQCAKVATSKMHTTLQYRIQQTK